MAEHETSKKWYSILEFLPVLIFFIGYFWLKDEIFVVNGIEYAGFIAVTALFVPLCLICMAIYWRLAGRLAPRPASGKLRGLAMMQVVTLVFVVIFGGLTIYFNDEWFLKMKPTIIYLLFAAILGFGLIRGRSFIQVVFMGSLPLSKAGWMSITRHTMIFCLALALANELIARNLSTDMWVYFKTFGLPIATGLFFAIDIFLLRRHTINDPNSDSNESHPS